MGPVAYPSIEIERLCTRSFANARSFRSEAPGAALEVQAATFLEHATGVGGISLLVPDLEDDLADLPAGLQPVFGRSRFVEGVDAVEHDS